MPPQTNRPINIYPQTGNNQFVPVMSAKSVASQTTPIVSGATGTITVLATTSIMRFFVKDTGIYLKWGSAPSTSAFDEYIPAGQIVEIPVPLEDASTLYYLEGDATAGTIIVTQK